MTDDELADVAQQVWAAIEYGRPKRAVEILRELVDEESREAIRQREIEDDELYGLD